MLTTFAIAAMFAAVLVTHSYMLKVIYRNASGNLKTHHKVAD